MNTHKEILTKGSNPVVIAYFDWTTIMRDKSECMLDAGCHVRARLIMKS